MWGEVKQNYSYFKKWERVNSETKDLSKTDIVAIYKKMRLACFCEKLCNKVSYWYIWIKLYLLHNLFRKNPLQLRKKTGAVEL